jgi:microcystin-dependent protein
MVEEFAMSEPFIGQVMMIGFTFAPRGWALCDGQILPIAQNTALFSLLGTTYGGNGTTTFALPDLRGRVPIHAGQGPGLSPYTLGQVGGAEQVTLLANQMPAHNHSLAATNAEASQTLPGGQLLAQSREVTYGSGALVGMNPQSIGAAGGSQPHENRQPYLTINFIIALEGIYPSRP